MKHHIIVDTNILSDLFAGDSRVGSILSASPTVYLSVIVMAELMYGYSKGTKEARNKLILDAFAAKPNVSILPCTAATAFQYARIRKALNDTGSLIPVNDIWIAAQTFETGSHLFTRDAHFAQVPGIGLLDRY